jgi:hypothetical protein
LYIGVKRQKLFKNKWEVVMPKVILALSFGKPSETTANRHIAELVRAEATQDSMIVADKSVRILGHRVGYIYIGPDGPQAHCSTINLVEEFVKLLEQWGWNEICIISQPIYAVRIERDLRRVLGARQQNFVITIKNAPVNRDVWYDSNSTQFHTKNEILNVAWEFILVILPWRWYEKITKIFE